MMSTAGTALPGTGAGLPARPAGEAKRSRAERGILTIVILALGLAVGIVASVMYGTAEISLGETVDTLWQGLWGGLGEAMGPAQTIVWNVRLPRVLTAALIGLNLATSGVLLQAIMRNPLAAPDVIGVTAGAGLAAAFVLVILPGLPTYLPAAAFLGAMTTALVVYAISWQPGRGVSPLRMVLAGVAVSAMLGAFTTFLMVMFGEQLQDVVLWMSGSLNGRSWDHLHLIWPYTLIAFVPALLLTRGLNVLQLGEDTARSLGARVGRIRWLAMLTAALLAASAVSVAGLIGFVGLIVPHILRLLLGPHHGWLLPASALGGAMLLVWADLGGRLLLSPQEMPVGILTALIGGPYFLMLLYRTRLIH